MNPKRTILAGLEGTGLDHVLLSAYDSLSTLTGDVSPAMRSFDKETPHGSVLFPLIPGYRTVCYRYCIIADALRRRGYEPILLYDDVTDAPFGRTVTDSAALTAETRFYRKKIPARFGLEPVGISDVLHDVPEHGRKYTDDPLADVIDRFALGSVRKRYKKYKIDLDNPEISESYQTFQWAGKVLADATREVLSRNQVHAVVAHEPYYVQGGVPLAVAKNNGVNAYSHVWGFLESTLLFGRATNRSSLPQYTDDDLVEHILEQPLSDEEDDEINRVMADRAAGKNVDVDYSSRTSRTVEEDGTVVGVFTNLLWDASLEPEESTYGDVYRWLSDTISELGGTEGTSVVVKTHPAEEKLGTNESVTGWFRDTYDELPENITLLQPDTDVNTYELLDTLDVGIVFNSTVGLEAAFRGIPVVVAGDTHYLGHGFTIDPASKSEYIGMVSSPDELVCTSEMHERARRYAHLLFVKRLFPFPYCRREQGSSQSFEHIEPSDTVPGTEPFDSLVSALIEGREVMSPEYAHLSRYQR